MSASLRVYQPTAPCRNDPQQLRRTLPRLTGAVIGFIDNAKPNFDHLADDLGELLMSRHGARAVIKRRKRGASVPAGQSVIEELSQQCDLVITGSGD